MVLAHLMLDQSNLELIIAHFDHGIRPDSAADGLFVRGFALGNSLDFYEGKGNLGKAASEETARIARYKFLNQLKTKTNSDGIVTAHHQDDVVETAVVNVLRGTGRKGLSSLASGDIIRPLLHFSKDEIIDYAQKNNIAWREDKSNQDTKYLRNYIRQNVLKNINPEQRKALISLIHQTGQTNKKLEAMLEELLVDKNSKSIENWLIKQSEDNVSREIMAAWLRKNKQSFDKKTLQRLVVNAKTKPPGTRLDISKGYYLVVEKKVIRLHSKESV